MTKSRCSCSFKEVEKAGMKTSIGGTRCGTCTGFLNQKQINQRLILELHQDQDQIFKLIGALQALGADQCRCCGNWAKDTFMVADICWCASCMKRAPGGILAADHIDDYELAQKQVVRYFASNGISVKWGGELLEVYRRMSL